MLYNPLFAAPLALFVPADCILSDSLPSLYKYHLTATSRPFESEPTWGTKEKIRFSLARRLFAPCKNQSVLIRCRSRITVRRQHPLLHLSAYAVNPQRPRRHCIPRAATSTVVSSSHSTSTRTPPRHRHHINGAVSTFAPTRLIDHIRRTLTVRLTLLLQQPSFVPRHNPRSQRPTKANPTPDNTKSRRAQPAHTTTLT